jgi:DNA primase
MATDTVDQVRSRLDILEVIGGYVTLHRAGREHVGLCPFHAEKSPSFSVNQERQLFHCHGCGAGGDVFSFIEGIEGVEFPRALEILAERAGVEIERGPRAGAQGARRRRVFEINDRAARYYEYVLWHLAGGEPGRRLLAERGVAEQLARRFRVGFAAGGGTAGNSLARYLIAHGASLGELVHAGLSSRSGRDLFRHRLVFPIADERGQVLGFGGRALGDAVPKYLNTPDTDAYHKSAALFGLDRARELLRERRVAVVVEGYFDVLAAHAAGVGNAVASSGTALTREQLRILARHADRAVLCFDADEAGRRAAWRAVELCAAEGMPARVAVLPPGVKDPDEMVRADPSGFAALIAEARPEWEVVLDWAMGEVGSAAEERRAAGDRAVALLASIPDPAVREPYVREAMRRLELWEGSDFPVRVTAAAAERQRRPRRGARTPMVAAPPAPGSPAPGRIGVAGSAPIPEGSPAVAASGQAERAVALLQGVPPSEQYLAIFAVQQPVLAQLMVGELGLRLEEVESAAVRRLIEAALAVPEGAAFPLHALSAADQSLAAGLAVREVAEVGLLPDPPALERAVADCVQQVHSAARRARARREIRQLLATPRDGGPADDEAVATRLRELIAEQRKD